MNYNQSQTTRFITAYEATRQAFHAARDAALLTETWRAHQDAEAALLDHVRRDGPVFSSNAVYAATPTGLLVVRGVRVVEHEATEENSNR